MDIGGDRRSESLSKVIEKKQDENVPFVNEFVSKIVAIYDDQPEALSDDGYILYRFTGAVSYLNYFDHATEIQTLVEKYIIGKKVPLLLSFRYSQIIDEESLE